MKGLFYFMLMLGMTAAHADSGFEFDLEDSPSLLGESKNFAAKYINEDSSVSIVKPKFSDPYEDGDVFISSRSDLNGVCKLYGLHSYVNNSRINHDELLGNSAVIDASSRFSGLESNEKYYTIGTITCSTTANTTPVSNNFKAKDVNDDKSTTIKNPKFKMNGNDLHLAASSDLNGVCRLYGFKSSVNNSKINHDARRGESVNVDGSSKFSGFRSNAKYYVIGSLICR